MTIKSAVVGLGGISAGHLTFLADDPRIDLVGVCDLSPATARHRAERHRSVPYTSLDALLAETMPDVVHVLTPPLSHEAIALQCLAAGADVVCEKPVVPDVPRLRGLLETAAAAGRRVVENQNYRWNDTVLEVDRLIADGVLGDVVAVGVEVAIGVAEPGGRFSDLNVPSPVAGLPAGVVHDFLPHLAYLALHPARAGDHTYPAISETRARWRNVSGNPLLRYDELAATFLAGDVSASVTFCARTKPEHFRLRVSGTAATVEIDLWRAYVRLERMSGPKLLATVLDYGTNGGRMAKAGVTDLVNKVLQHGPLHGIPRLLDDVYTAFIAGSEPPVTAQQMLACQELVDALVAQAPRVEAP